MGSMMIKRLDNRCANGLLRAFLCIVLALSGCLLTSSIQPTPSLLAYAETTEAASPQADTTPVPNELQQRVEATAAAYNQALANLADIEGQIANNQTEIDDISAQLATQREKSSQAAAEYYRMQRSSNTLLELLFSSQSISDLVSKMEYVARLQDSYLNDINRLTSLNAQLDDARKALELARNAAQTETIRAEEALADAKAAREDARIQAEAEAAAQAMAASMPVASPSVASPPIDNAEPDTSGDGDGSYTDRETFISHWAPRLDAYLGSYPLGGYGKDFAAAAWDYGVDPRVAAAIACNESGKGRVCFRPHNAWGWGNYSWPDWPTAIEQYTAGFSRGYGYVITLEGAKRYAPLSWETWYPLVISEMNRI